VTHVLMLGDQEIGTWTNVAAPIPGQMINSGIRTYRVLSVGQPDSQDRVIVQVETP
jgi:hypothetical protein